MRIQSFQQMLSEYGIAELETDDQNARKEMLVLYRYSVIIEGAFMEFDSLNKWIETNLGLESINQLFYGKTGYDFGFVEYFFAEEPHEKAVTDIAPRIYTIYPHSYPPNSTQRSNGYDERIIYNPMDEKAIVIELKTR